MSDETKLKMSVSGNGSVTIRKRPSKLLMKLTLRATESTLELGLANLKKQQVAAERWMKRLNACSVEFGEPHFANPDAKDPMRHMREVATRALKQRGTKPPSSDRKREVNVIMTALWDISAMSAEETLIFLDNLQFEATSDASMNEPASETSDENPTLISPEEQVQEMFAQLASPPEEKRKPEFLFISQLTEQEWTKVVNEAYARAYRKAELLAQAMGKKLGQHNYSHNTSEHSTSSRTEQIMERQRCGAILAGTSYILRNDEQISDDPRPTEFHVGVTLSFGLEPA